MSIDATASWGRLDITVWHLPSTSQGWKFGKLAPYTLNSFHTAETNGVVSVREGSNARGVLSLMCGLDQKSMTREHVGATMIAVHQTTNRFVPYASAMPPIRRGFMFKPVPYLLSADPGDPRATVEAYWTPLLPVA
jgi:hypothetical protein